MSTADPQSAPPHQPFQCHICRGRFTRHENLKRHAALHSRAENEASLPCPICQTTFSRPDLRSRHMKRKHPDFEEPRANTKSRRRREGRTSTSPLDSTAVAVPSSPQDEESMNELSYHPELLGSGLLSFLDPGQQFDASVPDLSPFNFTQPIPERFLSSDLPPIPQQDDWSPSTLQITTGCALFFTNVSHFLPFLHQATFDPEQTPRPLLFSILSLGYQHGDDPDSAEETESGASLSTRCFHRARTLVVCEESQASGANDMEHSKSMVQSYLFLQICAMMYLCGDESAHGLKMHSKMVSLARSSGLMQPVLTKTSGTHDLEALWREFIDSESHKRTVLAVHQVDALWYQFLSIPRSLSHLEIKHSLPCPEDSWTASSSADWAHRQLVTRHSGPTIYYTDAVRRFISPDADVASIPPFDPYGAINIAQFLLSSAREISGWSTMTGRLSMERLEPLRSSLVALRPFIQSQEVVPSTRSALCEATWETAMIELQLWSPSHTGGIVEGSLNAVLSQSTFLAPSREFLCESSTAQAIQPHVDWFLRYLDGTPTVESEAPWVTLYAYKAVLIAWQLVGSGIPGAMQVVGIPDGDAEGALRWAREAFRRRGRWQLGKLIMKCLEDLG